MYSFRTWGTGHSNERIVIPETYAFIERWELFMPKRYEDGIWKVDYRPPGAAPSSPPARRVGDIKWSIFFGHAEGGDTPPYVITEEMEGTIEEARVVLWRDVMFKERWVNARIPVPLTTYMYGAIVSLVYQYGQGRVDKAGVFLPAIQAGRYVDAACEMLQLCKRSDGTVSKGHLLRRASEVGFFMTRKDL